MIFVCIQCLCVRDIPHAAVKFSCSFPSHEAAVKHGYHPSAVVRRITAPENDAQYHVDRYQVEDRLRIASRVIAAIEAEGVRTTPTLKQMDILLRRIESEFKATLS